MASEAGRKGDPADKTDLPRTTATASGARAPTLPELYQYYQSGPVQCVCVFFSTLLNEMLMTQQVGAKSLAAYSSCVVGHSQGIASAACLSFISHAVRAVYAIFRQGLAEQKVTGLRHFSFNGEGRALRSNMLMLRGRPNAYLQYNCLQSHASLINAETSVVCSGRAVPLFVQRLRDQQSRWPGVESRCLPIPFASHSSDLTPVLFQLCEELRCFGFPGRKKVKPRLRVYPLAIGPKPRIRRPLDLWRIVLSKQLTNQMDFPAMVEQAATQVGVTDVIDLGPTDSSIASRLLADAGSQFKLVSGTVPPRHVVVVKTESTASLPSRIKAVAAEVLEVHNLGLNTPLKQVGVSSQRLGALRSMLLETVPECSGRLPTAQFFRAVTIGDVVELVAKAEAPTTQSAFPPIVHVSVYANKGTDYPLSYGQEQMVRVQTMNPSCTAYNVSSSVWISGGVKPARVKACLQAIISRHEVFSGLVVPGPPALRLLAATPTVSIVNVEDEAAALSRMGQIGRMPFKLASEPSIRAEVAVTPSGLVLVILWVHHMNFDILSQGLLHRELQLLLTAQEPPSKATARLPELAVQYVDFSVWSRKCVSQGLVDPNPVVAELAAHVGRALDLPMDKPRPKQWVFQADRVVTKMPFELELPQEGVTPFIAHLTAFFILLWKSAGQETVIVGVPYHGRDLAALQPLCGYFINMLPVIGRASARTTVATALVEVTERWQQAMEHAAVPFLLLVDSLNRQQQMVADPSRNSVFQAMLNYRAESTKPLGDRRFHVQPVHHLEGHVDLDVQVDAAEDGIVVTHNYCTALFEPRTAERFAAQYMAALRAITLEDWQHIQCWRIPYAPRLLEDLQEAEPISLEYSAQKLALLFAEMYKPVVACGPAGLQVLL